MTGAQQVAGGARSGRAAHPGWRSRLSSGWRMCAGLHRAPCRSLSGIQAVTNEPGRARPPRGRTEEISKADVNVVELGQLLQHLAGDHVAPPLVPWQLNHLLQPAAPVSTASLHCCNQALHWHSVSTRQRGREQGQRSASPHLLRALDCCGCSCESNTHSEFKHVSQRRRKKE